MAQSSFAATVSAWAAKTKERMAEVRLQAAQDIVEIMQTPVAKGGRMRVDTGFLRASLQGQVGMGAFTPKDKPPGVKKFSYDPEPINLVLLNAGPAETVTVGYTARYAAAREYGARGQPPDGFVRMAAQQWQRVVSEAATRIQREVESR